MFMREHLWSDLQVIVENLGKSMKEQSGYTIIITDNLKQIISTLFCKLRTKYQEAKHRDDYFFKKFESWLSTKVSFAVDAKSRKKSTGRPREGFDQLSDRSKRRRTEDIRTKYGPAELSYAAQMRLRSSGQVDASVVVKDVSSASPLKATKYRKVLHSSVSTNSTAMKV